MQQGIPKDFVVVLSGGLDSSVAMALAIQHGSTPLAAIFFDYGQRAVHRELEASRRIAEHFAVSHTKISLPWMNHFRGALTEGTALPMLGKDRLDDAADTVASASAVWVPNRNGVFLEIAAGIAENLRATGVVIGFNREEAATFPDNSAAYLEQINLALGFSSKGVRVWSPTVSLDKTEIVTLAQQMDFPLELVWSCYESGDSRCHACESCLRFDRAIGNANARNVSDSVSENTY